MRTPKGSRRRFPSDQGISLVEILVAMLLLTVGGFAAIVMQRSSIKANQNTYAREAAASLARQLIEATESVDYSDACLADTGASYVNPPACTFGAITPANKLNQQGLNDANGIFTRTWRITDSNATVVPANQLYKTIRVRIQWTDRGATNFLTLTSIKGW